MEMAKLTLDDGQEIELPVVVGTEGERAVDISALRAKTGYVTLDPAYMNTGSCKSEITFIDGEKGILRYRGYPIEELAEKASFIEVAYLLIYGELPNKEELNSFRSKMNEYSILHEDLTHVIGTFPRDSHPMAVMASGIAALSAYYKEHENVEKSMIRLITKTPMIAALSFRKFTGQPVRYPKPNYGFAENFLFMMFSMPYDSYEPNPVVSKAITQFLILHADHEQNCSTSTVRLAGSSLADIYTSVSCGVSALWGELHGGANQHVIEMLTQIHESGDSVSKYVEMAKDKSNPFKLSGFGHRVYKSFDPRAKILKQTAHELLDELNVKDPLLDIAQELEEAALSDEYFKSRNLYPNVDFYSGIILKAIGIPVEMFTVMFTIGRMPGWIAHWCERNNTPGAKISRPRQVYTGETTREFVPLYERK